MMSIGSSVQAPSLSKLNEDPGVGFAGKVASAVQAETKEQALALLDLAREGIALGQGDAVVGQILEPHYWRGLIRHATRVFGLHQEELPVLKALYALPPEQLSDPNRAAVLRQAGVIQSGAGNYTQARACFMDAADYYLMSDNFRDIAHCHRQLAILEEKQADAEPDPAKRRELLARAMQSAELGVQAADWGDPSDWDVRFLQTAGCRAQLLHLRHLSLENGTIEQLEDLRREFAAVQARCDENLRGVGLPNYWGSLVLLDLARLGRPGCAREAFSAAQSAVEKEKALGMGAFNRGLNCAVMGTAESILAETGPGSPSAAVKYLGEADALIRNSGNPVESVLRMIRQELGRIEAQHPRRDY